MILIGLIEQTTGTGISEHDYSRVDHQRTDIIAGSPTDTVESLTKLYNEMVQKAEKNRKKISEIRDELDYRPFGSSISNAEFERMQDKIAKLRTDTYILNYKKVLIVEGVVLK